ncbi:Glyoxalase-like domain protein [Stieleria bergensis]|uniref:Glyoxalase-like domain protein n=1 Tax=Stieleria bergensis TaxID=2528025 RepID=A0A517SUH4_9BACT|nr:Glyoxalase-like domain protein [Planctomycetes bacterium SV_7m_r]
MFQGMTLVIAVRDLQLSSRYYQDQLGFQTREIEDPGWRCFERDHVAIMAGECPDAMPAAELGDHSFIASIRVDDAKALYTELTEKQVTIVKQLCDESWGMREFGIQTIDGHRIMFAQSI